MNLKPYNLQVKVRNNYLLTLMRARGYNTNAEFSRSCGVSESVIGSYVNLVRPALTINGDVREPLVKMAKTLGVPPLSLVPPDHFHEPLVKNTAELTVDRGQIVDEIGDDSQLSNLITDENIDTLHDAMLVMPERMQHVVERRIVEGDTLQAIATDLGITRERVRGIEGECLVILRELFSEGSTVESVVRSESLGHATTYAEARMKAKKKIQSSGINPLRIF